VVLLIGAVVAVTITGVLVVIAGLDRALDGRAVAGPVHDRCRRAAASGGRGSGSGPTGQLVELVKDDSAVTTRQLALAHHLDLVRLELLQQGQDLGHPELVVVGDRELQILVLGDMPTAFVALVVVAMLIEAIDWGTGG